MIGCSGGEVQRQSGYDESAGGCGSNIRFDHIIFLLLKSGCLGCPEHCQLFSMFCQKRWWRWLQYQVEPYSLLLLLKSGCPIIFEILPKLLMEMVSLSGSAVFYENSQCRKTCWSKVMSCCVFCLHLGLQRHYAYYKCIWRKKILKISIQSMR